MPKRTVIAFAHIPKTGGTTMNSILRQNYGVNHFDRPGIERPLTAQDIGRIHWVFPGLKSLAGHPIRPNIDLGGGAFGLRFFTLLRNPIERMISAFKFGLRQRKFQGLDSDDLLVDFEDRLARQSNKHCRFLAGCECAEAAIEIINRRIGFVGLLERFDESLVLFRRWVDDAKLDIRYGRPKNTASREEERRRVDENELQRVDAIDRRLREEPRFSRLIHEANQQDQKLYDYVAGERYPAQCDAYGLDLDGDVQEFKHENAATPPRISYLTAERIHRNLVVRPLMRILLSPRE